MRRHVWKVMAFVVLCAGVLLAVSFAVMGLWNALVPVLFTGPVVTFWQAAGLLLLCRLLFGGFRGRGCGWRRGRWQQRWHRMSPEERTRFREGLRRWQHTDGAQQL